MASVVDICNLALARLGDEATVSSIDPPEGSAQAEHCKKFYPIARDTVLEAHPWKFAITRATLAKLSAVPPAGWAYYYAMPAMCANLLAVVSAGASDSAESEPFTIELLDATGDVVILTNVENAVARYSINQTDTTKYPALVVDAVAMVLASHLAGPVIKGTEGIKVAASWGRAALSQIALAKEKDAGQKATPPREQLHTPGWILAR